MLLSDFLRHVLGATGTHVGCEHGVCGACTVQIDGAPARSCITLAVQAEGADIRTVEGLAPAAATVKASLSAMPTTITRPGSVWSSAPRTPARRSTVSLAMDFAILKHVS